MIVGPTNRRWTIAGVKYAGRARVSSASVLSKLGRTGCVDTPAKFGVGVRSKLHKCRIVLSRFWLDHWTWVTGTAVAIAAVLVTYVKG